MQVLVDTSVWVDHFHKKDNLLINLLQEDAVFTHAFIIGELACGNIKNRNEILSHLQSLSQARLLNPEEVLFFINYTGRNLGLWISICLCHVYLIPFSYLPEISD